MSVFRLLFFLLLGLFLISCENSEPEVVSLGKTTELEQVGTIEIQETDERFIGAFETIDVTLDPFHLYVADTQMQRVAVVDGESGEILHTMGEPGEGPGEFQHLTRAVHMDGHIYAEHAENISVFEPDGTFLYQDRLPEGMQTSGRWTLTEQDGTLYRGVRDFDFQAEGLIRSPGDKPVAALEVRNESVEVKRTFGKFPALYQEEEFIGQTSKVGANAVEGSAYLVKGYLLTPEVQVYDLEGEDFPLAEVVEPDHPRFERPTEPMPIDLPHDEVQQHQLDNSGTLQVFLLSDGTVAHVFDNLAEGYFERDRDIEERHHYATLCRIDSGEQKHLELPGRVFARDAEDRLYIELNPVPDEREIGIYEVNGP